MGTMIPQKLIRPSSWAEWLERSQNILAPVVSESIKHGLSYQAIPSDVFITPFAKCGTTWLEQITHSLRTRGDMDFRDILEVIPWVEMAYWLRQDLYASQKGEFKVFKCHLSWDAVPKGGRYIVSFRDPKAALVSDYQFVDGYSWEKGAVSLEEHANLFMYGRDGEGGWDGNYWKHLISWWEQRDNPQVLLLCYENMREDLAGTIDKIASFLGIEMDQELQTLMMKHSSRDFMLTYQSKFSGSLLQEAMANIKYTPPSKGISMVKENRLSSPNQLLPKYIEEEMGSIWDKLVTRNTGLLSYEDLVQFMKKDSK